MISHARRQQPHVAAASVLERYGGTLCLDTPRFSPKWLSPYRPVRLQRRLRRRNPVLRLLEAGGLLPERYEVVADFDADASAVTVYGAQHLDLMRRAVRDIAEATGVEVTLVRRDGLVLRYYGGLR